MRCLPDLEVCEDGGLLWLRWQGRNEDVDLAVRKIPGARRFDVLADGAVSGVGLVLGRHNVAHLNAIHANVHLGPATIRAVNTLAHRVGGGGHFPAAGARIAADIDDARRDLLAQLDS